MSLSNKLLALVLIPLLSMLIFAGPSVLEKQKLASEMRAVTNLAEVSSGIGALVHELQKERGMSTGFIGSKGGKFVEDLPRQRQAVDQRRAQLERILSSFDASSYSPKFAQMLDDAIRRLGDLANTRNAVSALNISATDTIGYYSQAIGGMLDIVGQSATLSGDVTVTRLAIAYSSLLWGKEFAGLERATLSNVFSADKFSPAMLQRFLAVTVTQDTWIKVFLDYASPDQAQFFKGKLSGPIVDEVNGIKQAALAKMNDASLGQDASQWFAKSTARIDLLKAVEDRMANDLTDTAGQALVTARRLLMIYAALAGFAILVTGFITFKLIKDIMAQIGGEPVEAVRIARAIASGRLDNEIPLRPGDHGSLLADMKVMQQQLKDRIETERVMAETNLRIRIALDNVSTGVMIADRDRNVIYTNTAVQRVLKGAENGIRKQLPQFRADGLVGMNIDSFHQNPAHQAQLLASMVQPYTAHLVVGDRHMTVTANPVINERGERLGSVAEWTDRTAEVMVEREVEGIVAAASRGDFETRIDTTGKKGFFAELGNNINALLDNTEEALEATSKVLTGIANGDLTHTFDRDYEGIFGRLKEDTNKTVKELRELVGQIKETSDMIHTAAKEIAAGNQDLSNRTEHEASSLEETASSMEQLNATVRQNAESARLANELTHKANEIVSKGGDMVHQVVDTMVEIQGSSHRMADIIGVIDSIAFQTNILALNAAVEAARAGEQGRGFAVVATEVRSLAQRCSMAAKEIKQMIDESVDKVETGSKLVKETGATMEEVVHSFRQVGALVTDIAHASDEQRSGIEQVTTAVGQMDGVTQQNAALVEEATAAAKSLEEQAGQLVRLVSGFRLNDSEGSTPRLRYLPAP